MWQPNRRVHRRERNGSDESFQNLSLPKTSQSHVKAPRSQGWLLVASARLVPEIQYLTGNLRMQGHKEDSSSNFQQTEKFR